MVGRGARTHCLALRLHEDVPNATVYRYPNNPAISNDVARYVPEVRGYQLATWARDVGVDLAVIVDERFLALGLADEFRAAGITTFGASKRATTIETQRLHTKQLMQSLGIASPDFRIFEHLDEAINARSSFPDAIVVKLLSESHTKAVAIARDRSEHLRAFALAAAASKQTNPSVLVEDFHQGPECTITLLCDGQRMLVLPPVTEYQYSHSGKGARLTGGMAGFSEPARRSSYESLARQFGQPLLEALVHAGHPVIGSLALDLMFCRDRNQVLLLEANVHWGDPQLQTQLPLVDGNMAYTLDACARGQLDQALGWNDGLHASTFTVAANGYGTSRWVEPIIEPLHLEHPDVAVFAYDMIENDGLRPTGGRVLSVRAVGTEAVATTLQAGQAAQTLSAVIPGVGYRSDLFTPTATHHRMLDR